MTTKDSKDQCDSISNDQIGKLETDDHEKYKTSNAMILKNWKEQMWWSCKMEMLECDVHDI